MKQGETKLGSELSHSVLRDHASGDRVEAIWRRIADELPAPQYGRLGRRGLRPLLWVAAAFVGGIVLGVELSGGSEVLLRNASVPLLQAEPREQELALDAPPSERTAQQEQGFTERSRPSANTQRFEPPPMRSARGPRSSFDSQRVDESNAAATPEWQHLAERGDYDEALKSIEASGGFDAELRMASAERLMLLGDVARATGNRPLAAQALRRVIHEHAADPLAPLAAWSLGNMLEKAGDRPGAAEAFAMYRSLSPQGDFAEDALARQVRVAVEESDLELATRLAAQYEKSFPDGRRAKEIREQLARLRAKLPATAGGALDAGAGATGSIAAPQDPLLDDSANGDSIDDPASDEEADPTTPSDHP